MSRTARDLPRDVCAALTGGISRHPGDAVRKFGSGRWFLAKIDIGAFVGVGAHCDADGSALVLAGEALVARAAEEPKEDRTGDCRQLFSDLHDASQDALRCCAGTFCAAFYSAPQQRLTLVADKLGVRPIYYVVTPQLVVFASALRVLEAAGLCGGEIDERGIYETCAFGFPLGDRTCYGHVRTIKPAELVHVGRESETHEQYYRWDALSDDDCDDEEYARRLLDGFDTSVRRRLHGDTSALSFLSGGLDSRAIVASLRNSGAKVTTVNFAPPGTQDRAFALAVANALGADHHQLDVPLSVGTDVYRQAELRKWVDSLPAAGASPERPLCIWSGDGGSVGMGHVYLDNDTVDLFDRGDVEAGLRSFASYNRLPGASNRAMKPQFRQRSRDWHIDGIRSEINALAREPDSRALRLFLMFNDQRRHMAKHFENIDVNRFEFLLPFFDGDFLETIMRAPVGPFLRHCLYHKWLARLSPQALTVPWQTYPGHLACPIPFDKDLRYQWGDYFGRSEDRRLARRQGRDAIRYLLSMPFPAHLISRAACAPAVVACLLGSSAYSHVVQVGTTFAKYWQRCRSGASSAGWSRQASRERFAG